MTWQEFEQELETAARQTMTTSCPPDRADTVRGYKRYSNDVTLLPLGEQGKIANIVNAIVKSFRPGSEQIQIVRSIGHADKDLARGPMFERQISGERAQAILNLIVKAVNNPEIASRIIWRAIPAGSTQIAVANPRRESERQCNRRVQILPSTAASERHLDNQLEQVLRAIQDKARQAANRPRTVAGSKFAAVVQARYLREYLKNPNRATAAIALDRIGRQNTSGTITAVCGVPDLWERATPLFNGRAFPDALRRVPGLQWLPANFGAATEILTVKNRRTFSYIDVPFLLGSHTINWFDCSARVERNFDPDLQFDNSKNESQLMHWATGVRFATLDRQRLRELFLGYELWHLEYWDVFGPDPLNDLIAEDAGRHMAVLIGTLRMNTGNVINLLDEGFRAARAWVGALLRLRRDQLDGQIRADPPPSSWMHWIAEVPSTSPHHPFPAPAVRQMLASGLPPTQVMESKLVGRYVEVYTLLFEADKWERTNGIVAISPLQYQMATSALDSIFRAVASAESRRLASRFLSGRPQSEAGWGDFLRGCTPCVGGWKICHKNIVPDDGSCRYIGWDNWYCRC